MTIYLHTEESNSVIVYMRLAIMLAPICILFSNGYRFFHCDPIMLKILFKRRRNKKKIVMVLQ